MAEVRPGFEQGIALIYGDGEDDRVSIIPITGDPTTGSGIVAPVGTVGICPDGATYTKTGGSNTDWTGGGTLGQGGASQSVQDTLVDNVAIVQTVYEVYETGFTTFSNQNPTIVNMDTERFSHPDFSLSSGRVTVANGGRYKISYSLTAYNYGNQGRVTLDSELYVNGDIVPGTFTSGYYRQGVSGESTAAKTAILDLSDNDIVDVRSIVYNGNSNVCDSLEDGSNLVFERIT